MIARNHRDRAVPAPVTWTASGRESGPPRRASPSGDPEVFPMARNVRLLHCSPEAVFDVLANGWLYPLGGVGA